MRMPATIFFHLDVKNERTEDMANAVVAVAAKGHNEVIDILLVRGADINAGVVYKVKKRTYSRLWVTRARSVMTMGY